MASRGVVHRLGDRTCDGVMVAVPEVVTVSAQIEPVIRVMVCRAGLASVVAVSDVFV